jgi:hypothetical protein
MPDHGMLRQFRGNCDRFISTGPRPCPIPLCDPGGWGVASRVGEDINRGGGLIRDGYQAMTTLIGAALTVAMLAGAAKADSFYRDYIGTSVAGQTNSVRLRAPEIILDRTIQKQSSSIGRKLADGSTPHAAH